MKREIVAVASCYTEKYYLNPIFEKLPVEVKCDLREIVILASEKIHGIFEVTVEEDGFVLLSTSKESDDFNHDEIGAGLETKKIEREHAELLEGIGLWYKLVYLEGSKEK